MKKTILALLLGLCALSSYAYMYDWNELPMIPKILLIRMRNLLIMHLFMRKMLRFFGMNIL